MKNKIRIFSILSLMLVITLASCSNGGGDSTPKNDNDSSGGGQTISGSSIVSGAQVTYASGVSAEAKSYNNFSFSKNGDPLSNYVNPASVAISGNKVTIELGVPKNSSLDDTSYYTGLGLTVNPANANVFIEDDFIFLTQDQKYGLFCMKDYNNYAYLVYADRDVTMNGTYTKGDYTEKYNCSFKKGWNYLITSESGKTATNTSSISQPNGYKWTVTDADW